MCIKDCFYCKKFVLAENKSVPVQVLPGVIAYKDEYVPSHCSVNNKAYLDFMAKYGNIPRNEIAEKGYEPDCNEFEEEDLHRQLRLANEAVAEALKIKQ